jgi:small subunit ribosomal protein S11
MVVKVKNIKKKNRYKFNMLKKYNNSISKNKNKINVISVLKSVIINDNNKQKWNNNNKFQKRKNIYTNNYSVQSKLKAYKNKELFYYAPSLGNLGYNIFQKNINYKYYNNYKFSRKLKKNSRNFFFNKVNNNKKQNKFFYDKHKLYLNNKYFCFVYKHKYYKDYYFRTSARYFPIKKLYSFYKHKLENKMLLIGNYEPLWLLNVKTFKGMLSTYKISFFKPKRELYNFFSLRIRGEKKHIIKNNQYYLQQNNISLKLYSLYNSNYHYYYYIIKNRKVQKLPEKIITTVLRFYRYFWFKNIIFKKINFFIYKNMNYKIKKYLLKKKKIKKLLLKNYIFNNKKNYKKTSLYFFWKWYYLLFFNSIKINNNNIKLSVDLLFKNNIFLKTNNFFFDKNIYKFLKYWLVSNKLFYNQKYCAVRRYKIFLSKSIFADYGKRLYSNLFGKKLMFKKNMKYILGDIFFNNKIIYFKKRNFKKETLKINNFKKQTNKFIIYNNLKWRIFQKNLDLELIYFTKYIGIVNIYINLNNIFVSICNLEGAILFNFWSGKLGIKGSKKATVNASTTICEKVQEHLFLSDKRLVFIKYSGIMHTRKMKGIFRGLFCEDNINYKIIKIINVTPKPHNGVRQKKKKKV